MFTGNFTLPLAKANDFRSRLLNWLKQYKTFAFYDSCNYKIKYSSFDFILGVHENDESILPEPGLTFPTLSQISFNQWLFGYIGYDCKNEVENLSSNNPTFVNAPDSFFFAPTLILFLKNEELTIKAAQPEAIYKAICETPLLQTSIPPPPSPASKKEWVKKST